MGHTVASYYIRGAVMERQIVSIAAVSSPLGEGKTTLQTLYALANDGTVWEHRSPFGPTRVTGQGEWRQLPPLPTSEK